MATPSMLVSKIQQLYKNIQISFFIRQIVMAIIFSSSNFLLRTMNRLSSILLIVTTLIPLVRRSREMNCNDRTISPCSFFSHLQASDSREHKEQ